MSVREITGAPLLFLGTGEKSDGLEAFDPDRMARRILGMGDVVALVEEVRRNVDAGEAERLAKKVAKGKGFDFNDLKSQLQQLQKMGGMGSVLDKLPGGAAAAQKMARRRRQGTRRQNRADCSITARERRRPEIIDGSRRRRIAAGAGMQVQDVNRRLKLKQHQKMQKMMKQLGSGQLQRIWAPWPANSAAASPADSARGKWREAPFPQRVTQGPQRLWRAALSGCVDSHAGADALASACIVPKKSTMPVGRCPAHKRCANLAVRFAFCIRENAAT